jgi:hypothetical protein
VVPVMAIVPPAQHGRPTVTWTVVLRVEPGRDCVTEAASLDVLPVGASVVLDVEHHPHDVDPRVGEFVRSAWRTRALHLDLHGRVGPVGAWWRELTQLPDAPPRHLHLIHGGADGTPRSHPNGSGDAE